MGDLGEGEEEEEEEGGEAGLGMGDVLGGVVTFDVTVGGASGERENESKLVTMSSQIQQKHRRFLQNSKAKILDEKLMLPVASGMGQFFHMHIQLLLHTLTFAFCTEALYLCLFDFTLALQK